MSTDFSCPFCPLAQSADPVAKGIRDYEYGVAWANELVRCAECGLVRQHPPVRSDQIAQLYPANYQAHQGSLKGIYGRLKSILAQRGAKAVCQQVPQNGRLLEVGCGNGGFLSAVHAIRPDIALYGVDIQRIESAFMQKVHFFEGQFEEADFGAEKFDMIYFSNLIEHVPDPLKFLKKAADSLTEKGQIYLVTPNHRSLDRYIFGRYWAGYHYPRHTFLMDHKNIVPLMSKAGLSILKIKGAYAFWALSIANITMKLPGTKKRGLWFAGLTALFLPFDILVNLFMPHGSMSVRAGRPLE